MKKQDLDKRICDCEGGSNTQTYREFLIEGEKEFEFKPSKLDEMTEEKLNKALDFIDYLWEK